METYRLRFSSFVHMILGVHHTCSNRSNCNTFDFQRCCNHLVPSHLHGFRERMTGAGLAVGDKLCIERDPPSLGLEVLTSRLTRVEMRTELLYAGNASDAAAAASAPL
eukprot:6177582-Pleurochrysis_carterae.AAC.2